MWCMNIEGWIPMVLGSIVGSDSSCLNRITKLAKLRITSSKSVELTADVFVLNTRRFAPRAAYAARHARSERKNTPNYLQSGQSSMIEYSFFMIGRSCKLAI